MPKINLAQETLRSQTLARRRQLLYVLSVAILVVVASVWGLIFFLTTNEETKAANVEKEVSDLQNQLSLRGKDVQNIVLFRDRLQSIKAILEQHVHWTQLLGKLEADVLPQVVVSSLQGQVTGSNLRLVVRTPSLDSAADLIASLKNEGKNTTPFLFISPTGVRAVFQEGSPGTARVVIGYDVQLDVTTKGDAYQLPSTPVVPSPAPSTTPVSSPLPSSSPTL